MTWTLVDGEAQNAAFPRSFFIPDRATRAGLEPGDIVKLVFVPREGDHDDPHDGDTHDGDGHDGDGHDDAHGGDGGEDGGFGGERMWVVVTARTTDGYVGRLDNDPVAVHGLAAGDRIVFAARHVVSVYDATPDPHAGQVAFASERLFDEDDPGVGWAFHDPEDAARGPMADGRAHSGWSFLAGDESREDLDDPSRIRLPSLAWLLERHPELGPLVDDHDGSDATYVRDGGRFVRQGD